jgi:hypothetical protein
MKFPLFLNNKCAETSTDVFRTWVVEVEVQMGRKVKCVRMDLGGEFDNTVFLGFCAERGIHVEKVPKASSAANGHVEHGNRTMVEGTRTQLIDSLMSHRFWAKAAAAHCYVRGFIPSSRHPDVVPWVAWFQWKDGNGNLVKLNVSHLRVWGSKRWVKDLDHVEGKLGNQGWEGRMVGYMGWRRYHIFDPKWSCIFQVRNVIFKEGDVHCTRASSDEDNSDPLPCDHTIFEDEDIPAAHKELVSVPPPPITPPAPAPPPPNLNPAPVVGDPPRRTGRIPKPTRAVIEMEMFYREEEQAKIAGEEWAMDTAWPTVNAVDIDWADFDDKWLLSLWVFASAVKGRVPHSYKEAMREPEKWEPAMRAEFNQLEARGVWRLVDLPDGEHAIDGMWVYDVKVDSDSNVLKYKG